MLGLSALSILPWLKKYWIWIAIALAVIGLAGGTLYYIDSVRDEGREAGKTEERDKIQKEIAEETNNNIEISNQLQENITSEILAMREEIAENQARSQSALRRIQDNIASDPVRYKEEIISEDVVAEINALREGN